MQKGAYGALKLGGQHRHWMTGKTTSFLSVLLFPASPPTASESRTKALSGQILHV